MPKKKLYNTTGIVYSTDIHFTGAQPEEDLHTLPVQEQLLIVKTDGRHRGGKLVTLIGGFTGSHADLEALGKQLKSFCGTGGSVKNNEVIIQGDNREKIFLWLLKAGYKKVRKC
jgi:translation initiation factor 1